MTAEEYYNKGIHHFEKGDNEQALKHYEKSIQLNKNFAHPWNGKGNIYDELEDYANAIKSYDKAIELDKNFAAPWNGRGNICYKLKDYDNALDSYNEAIKLDKTLAEPWHGKGNVYKRLNDFSECIKYYKNAIKLGGDDVLTWHEMAKAYFQQDDYENALDSYNKAIKLDSNWALLHNGIGNTYYKLNKYETALQSYIKAIKLDKTLPLPHNGIGNVCFKLNKYEIALKHYNEAIELDKNFAFPWNGKGSVYFNIPDLLESQQYQKAQIHFKRALVLGWNPVFLSNYLKIWQFYSKHPFFLQGIFKQLLNSQNLTIKREVTSMCQYINHWQEYLNKTEKYNQLSEVSKTQFQALINYFMGHPSKAFNILKDEVIPQDSDNLQAYYYLIMSCYEFLENEKSYLETALEIAKKYQKAPFNFNQNEIIQRYYAAHLFWINKDINAAIECLQPVWKSANFLPAAYFYLELNYRKKQYATFDSDEEISDEIYWTDEDIGILKEKHIEEIGDFIMEAEGDGNTKYTFSYGFPIHKIKPDAEEWWQPVYHYAHYREITNAIDLLQFQAKHVFETDVKGSQDLKDFWDCFKIDEKDIITMSEEIRKVGLQKVGQAFLNRTEVHVKDMVGKVDKSEAELKDAIYQVVYGRGDTKEQTKQTFEHLETTLEKASDVQDALVNRIASKIEAKELDGDTETYLYLISYFLLLQELSPKESIYLQFYALYADAFRSGGISKVVQGGVKDVVKTLTGEGFDMAVDVLTAINPVTGLAKATLKPFVKGSMGEFFIAFLKGVQQKTMMQYSISQGIKDGYSIPSFKESFLEFVGKEKDRLGEQFEQTYPLYGYEDWLE